MTPDAKKKNRQDSMRVVFDLMYGKQDESSSNRIIVEKYPGLTRKEILKSLEPQETVPPQIKTGFDFIDTHLKGGWPAGKFIILSSKSNGKCKTILK